MSASWIYTGDHVSVYILLSVNKNVVTPHVTKQNKQTSNNVYHSYQGLCSLEILWQNLDSAEEDKQVYQILGKQDTSRTRMVSRGHGPHGCSLYRKSVKGCLSG